MIRLESIREIINDDFLRIDEISSFLCECILNECAKRQNI